MTNEEARAILENEKKCVNRANRNDYCNRDCYNCELVKTDTEILNALDMAIKALEQEPTYYPPCIDCNKKMDEIRRAYDKLKEQEPQTGHWIEKDGFDGDTYYDCSECGESFCLIDGTPTDNLYNYCPNCGAKMESEG